MARLASCRRWLCLLAVLVCFVMRGSPLPAQQAHPAVSATVSVAALAVPAKARQHLERAKDAARRGKDAAFTREIQKAISLYPRLAEAYLLLADSENRAGHLDAALEHALLSRQLDPHSPYPALVIASIRNSQGRYLEASQLLGTLSTINGWQFAYETARAAIGLEDTKAALTWSTRALQAAPLNHPDAHLLLANALQLNHNWAAASEQLELYLASTQPLLHEAPVRNALAFTRRMAGEESSNSVNLQAGLTAP